mgnify:CR=1 FL=1
MIKFKGPWMGALVLIGAGALSAFPAEARQGGHGAHGVARGGISGGYSAGPRSPIGPGTTFAPPVGGGYKARGGFPKAYDGGSRGYGHVGPPPGSRPHVGKPHRPHHRYGRVRPYPYLYRYEPYYYYDYEPVYIDECAWLYRKAKRTGSRYWWRRYRDCVED